MIPVSELVASDGTPLKLADPIPDNVLPDDVTTEQLILDRLGELTGAVQLMGGYMGKLFEAVEAIKDNPMLGQMLAGMGIELP